jgi:hypothetical protein
MRPSGLRPAICATGNDGVDTIGGAAMRFGGVDFTVSACISALALVVAGAGVVPPPHDAMTIDAHNSMASSEVRRTAESKIEVTGCKDVCAIAVGTNHL